MEKKKHEKYTSSFCLERTCSKKIYVNYLIIGQRKASHRERIPESSCARKETVDIDILVTCRNGDRKIRQSIKITSRPASRIRKWNQLSQVR